MESKPSRIPRRISVQPSSSLSARMMSGSRGSSLNDTYHSRDSSFRLDSEYQLQRMIPKKMETITEHLILPNFIRDKWMICEQVFIKTGN
uniref:Membrane associated ring-CH-type finger 7 n=1 Tax=Equus asinus TaxID=9793 RepID=A0A9L0IGJ6_EQUAS